MQYKKSLFIFRRDLRLQDNTGLLKALDESDEVLACFIFDPRQVEEHDYRSVPALQFMIESLEDLQEQLQDKDGVLACYSGKADEVVESIIKSEKIEAVFLNQDYTPFSLKRDDAIESVCSKNDVQFFASHDALLQPPGTVLKDDGEPYTVYTPFKKSSAANHQVPKTQRNLYKSYTSKLPSSAKTLKDYAQKLVPNRQAYAVQGGTHQAENILRRIGNFADYKDTRDLPAKEDGTTRLSAHHKFGTVSIRDVYHVVASQHGADCTLIAELYWRDFFTHIAWYFPHVFEGAFHKKYNQIQWSRSTKNFEAWCQGKTGYPIVDAGMRQLNETGYMHNRVRMITASFLVKDLHINWQWGEKYFAQKLIDYDPAVNNGNWQWAASTGCDAQPYFRIFNPWLQQKKYDADCEYIKRWVPELADLKASEIHKIEKGQPPLGYPGQIVDHYEAREIAKEMYENV